MPLPRPLPAKDDPVRGKALYDTHCLVCHATGVAGASKMGDRAAWEKRLAKGLDTLLANAIKGIGTMPPKGGAGISKAGLARSVAHISTSRPAASPSPYKCTLRAISC